MASPACRVIAFYLPQFHTIPENDRWWGEGFTEWTNVRKARPMFPGHFQPNEPGELGYYSLLDPETRRRQADLAARHGVEAFCYWHYWFGNGKQLLEKPFDEVLRSGEPDFPFCLGWANHPWTKGTNKASPEKLLIDQLYPGIEDHRLHFKALEKAFHDKRYLRVDGKPLFFVFDPLLPEAEKFIACWSELARQSGLPGIYFVAHLNRGDVDPASLFAQGFSGTAPNLSLVAYRLPQSLWTRALRRFGVRLPGLFSYRKFIEDPIFSEPLPAGRHAVVFPNWDDTPRRGWPHGFLLAGSTPELFRRHVRAAVAATAAQPPERRLLFIRSWNEWAEGNYLEPDRRYGRRYLEALLEELQKAGG